MIYLDHNATTPIVPEVLEAMMPFLTSEWGNLSASSELGTKLNSAIETTHKQVAELLFARQQAIRPRLVEDDNLLLGFVWIGFGRCPALRRAIVTSNSERNPTRSRPRSSVKNFP